MEIQEKDIKDTLEELAVPFEDIYCLSDGVYGYWIILTSNLEEEHKITLVNLDFEQIKEDLWLKRVEGPEQIPDYKTIELKGMKQERIWNECLELIVAINSICYSDGKDPIFKPTTNFVAYSNKLKGFLCTNDTFCIFCEHLHKCIVESSGNRVSESFKNEEFYKALNELRNHCKHDREHGKGFPKKYSKVSKIFLKLITRKWPIEKEDFIELEFRILEECRKWLKELAKSLV